MKPDLPQLADDLLSAARKAGADAADTLIVNATSLSIDVRDGKLEQAERSEGIDLGLRVFVGQRQACVSASDASSGTLAQMAERAVAMAAEAPEDPYAGLADAEQLATVWDLDALDLADPAPEPAPKELELAALEAEAAARDVVGVSAIDAASAGYGASDVHLANSAGFSAGYRRTENGLYCVAITGQGTEMERDHSSESRLYRADMPGAAEIGKTAGERAVARSGPRKPPTGAFPVLFDERVASGLIGHLLMAVNGAAIARGSSWLRDALGEQVLPSGLTLTEEPHRARIAGSRPFDAEGLPTARRDIVQNGHLTGWTLDLASARKLGMNSTANAVRGTSAPPSPGMSNIVLSPGSATREDLLAQMGTGLLVTSLIGSSINPTTGDYSRGASGHWVENGQIAYPVSECTIAGNLRDMLLGILPANDAKPHRSRRVPSLLVPGLTIAGQ